MYLSSRGICYVQTHTHDNMIIGLDAAIRAYVKHTFLVNWIEIQILCIFYYFFFVFCFSSLIGECRQTLVDDNNDKFEYSCRMQLFWEYNVPWKISLNSPRADPVFYQYYIKCIVSYIRKTYRFQSKLMQVMRKIKSLILWFVSTTTTHKSLTHK